jgi:hypothetical protein
LSKRHPGPHGTGVRSRSRPGGCPRLIPGFRQLSRFRREREFPLPEAVGPESRMGVRGRASTVMTGCWFGGADDASWMGSPSPVMAGSSLLGAGVSLRLPNSTGPRSRSRIARRALRAGRNEGLAPSPWCHPRRVDDNPLRAALPLPPADARDQLRRLLIRDHPDRDAIAKQLLQRRTSGAVQLAELVDMLRIDDEARRRMVRILGELGATES